MSLWYAAPERLSGQKKVNVSSKGGSARPHHLAVPVSTINIGVEDFPSPNSSEELLSGHCNYNASSSSQRPPRGAVHFNVVMSKTAPPPPPPPPPPRHVVQINKTSPAAGNLRAGNGAILPSSSIASSRGLKTSKFGSTRSSNTLLRRDVTASDAHSRQKQRPSTAGASGEKSSSSSEGKGNVIFQRHSSCELREHHVMKDSSPSSQRERGRRSSFFPDTTTVQAVPLERGSMSEFGMSMRDMSESLSKIEELIFPSCSSKSGGGSSGQSDQVVMRENMAFEAAPMLPESEFFDHGSTPMMTIKPRLYSRSHSRNSDGDVDLKEKDPVNGCVRKHQQRRAQSALKGRRSRKGCGRSSHHEIQSQSCGNDIAFREEVNNRKWTMSKRSSGEFSSSSLPLTYDHRSESESGDDSKPSARRRWPKIRQLFPTPASRSETESTTTTQVSTDDHHSPNTASRRALMCRSATSSNHTSKSSRRSRLKVTNHAGDHRTTPAHESGIRNVDAECDPSSSSSSRKVKDSPLHHDQTLKRSHVEGFEEENEVLMISHNNTEEKGDSEPEAKGVDHRERDGSSSDSELESSPPRIIRKVDSSATIVLPTQLSGLVSNPVPEQIHAESSTMVTLFPTKEAQEQETQLSTEIDKSENHDNLSADERSVIKVSKSQSKIHDATADHQHLSIRSNFYSYADSSSASSDSADEKRVDVDVLMSGAADHHHHHQESLDGLESGDVFDGRCGKRKTMCTHVQDKAITQVGNSSNVHASLSTEKLCSILSYLGQVERSNLQEPSLNLANLGEKGCTVAASCFYSPRGGRESPRAVLEHAEDAISLTSSSQTALSGATFPMISGVVEGGGESVRTAESPNPAIAATTVFDGVRKKVQELRHKIAEQETKIGELQAENEKLVREREKHMNLEREKYYKQLEDQAAEYKVIIQHHLSVNEKMLRDKEQLTEKCCNLAGILSVAESKFDEKLKQLSEQWAREMKKAKELWAVGEKQRQKVWQEKKLKDLKETAIRGLEPHLDILNDKHRHEIAKMEAQHAEDLQSKLGAQNLDHRRQMCELRDHLQQERDKMLDNERLAAHARMAEVAERFEQQAIQQRMRVAAEITAQLERSEAGRREDKHYSQDLLARLHKEASEREETLRKQMEKKVEEMAVIKDRQIEQLKSQMVATAEQFQQKINDHITEGMRDREKELRTKLTIERDEQIELVIERLESEKEVLVTQTKEEVATKVNEIVAEKLEVERELKEYKSKLSDLGDAVRLLKEETELEIQDAGKKIAAFRKEIQNQARVIEELHDQAAQHDTELRNQAEAFEARLKDEQSRLQQTKLDLNQSNSKANEMRTRKVEELAEVEARVRKAIVKKDVVIANLREQLLSAHRQIKATEYLIQREHNAFISES